MVEDDRYCIGVIHQISAVEGALTRARREVFRTHVAGCVPDAIRRGDIDQVVEELAGAAFGAAPRRGDEPRDDTCRDDTCRGDTCGGETPAIHRVRSSPVLEA